MDKNAAIYVAGHRGLVGSAIARKLVQEGYRNLLLRTRDELDLCDQQNTNTFFQKHRPQYVFLAAAIVGGILANSTRPADFIRDNLLVQTNVIHSAWCHGTRKLFWGSSCVCPKFAPQSIRESSLLTSPLEPTNDAYAIAKIAGVRMVHAYRQQYRFSGISLMPTNLYGPGDNFELTSSHALPALSCAASTKPGSRGCEKSSYGERGPRVESFYMSTTWRTQL
jgi:GDP-L-fucose synthase